MTLHNHQFLKSDESDFPMPLMASPAAAADCAAHYTVLIIGGGAAGITVAAQLRRQRPHLPIALVEPQGQHSYQPGWTLVGAGVLTRAQTQRAQAGLIPPDVAWIRSAVVAFSPAENRVQLQDGRCIAYAYLVVCPGLKLDWEAIDGLTENLGKNGVCSNYCADSASYTWQLIKNFQAGNALFTQPAMPIKCAGAPQKIMYLMADHLRRKGLLERAKIDFFMSGTALFGVPFFVPALQKIAADYGIHVRAQHTLKAIDGKAQVAIFSALDETGQAREVLRPFDFLHVVPPQRGHAAVAGSSLADAAGWVEVDPTTLRHVRYANIFSLGDACSTPNAKTAAAVRMQAPVVVANLLAALDGQSGGATYVGYGACPLTVAYGRIILAEFSYGGKITPSFPLDPRIPRRSMWYLKARLLPWLYWSQMLRGKHALRLHHIRQW